MPRSSARRTSLATRLLLAGFGAPALLPATVLGRRWFRGERARALLAGCAAHSILPLTRPVSAAIGLLFLITGHVQTWPVAKGGSASITDALAAYLETLGGRIETGHPVRALADLPPSRIVLFDTSPDQVATIASPVLPGPYVRRLRRYRYGPGIFKIDWALDGPIPWTDPACLDSATVHVGGTLAEITESEAAVWRGRARRPALHHRRPAEPLRRISRARRQAHGLGVLPCPQRVDGGPQRGNRDVRSSGSPPDSATGSSRAM